MKVLICGGRRFDNYLHLVDVLGSIAGITLLIHGECKIYVDEQGRWIGADMLADRWAREVGVDVVGVPAEWGKYGKAAGPKRNYRMITKYNPDLVVAFPGGNGTAGCVRLARAAGILVLEV